MVTKGYTLEDFIQDLTDKLKRETDQDKLLDQGSALLERLVRNPECIPPEYRVPAASGKRPNHGEYLLHRSPEGLMITAVVWGPGDHIGPHDHHTWGMIGVLENVLHETRYRRLDDGSRPNYAKLEKDRVAIAKAGEVSLLIPDVDEIHEIHNPDDHATVEIHIYGKNLAGLDRCRFYPETDKVIPFSSGQYDNE